MIMLIHLLLSPLLLLAVSSRKNNVLMIVVDDLRYDMEPMRFHQPNMDALASRGVHFTRAFAQYALCSPSRSSLLTGLRPGTTMVRDLTTHFRTHVPDAITLPQQFRKHGYRTLGAGKIFHRGLQDNASWSEPQPLVDRPNYHHGGNLALDKARKARSRREGIMTGGKVKRGPPLEAASRDAVFHDEVVADAVVNWLREEASASGPPFFIAAGFVRPHLPFVAPRQFFEVYDPKLRANALDTVANTTYRHAISSEEIPVPPHARHPRGEVPSFVLGAGSHELLSYFGVKIRALNVAPTRGPASVSTVPVVSTEAEAIELATAEGETEAAEQSEARGLSRRKGRQRVEITPRRQGESSIQRVTQTQLRHAYAAAVAYTDYQVGRLIHALDEHTKLSETTWIVLFSDHGFKLGEHGAWGKNCNSEYDTRVPLTVVPPRAWRNYNAHATKEGTTLGALVELVDIYPTMLDLLQVHSESTTHPLEGSSFARLLSNASLAAQVSGDSDSDAWKVAAFSEVMRRGQRSDHQSVATTMGYSMRTPRFRLTIWVRLLESGNKLADATSLSGATRSSVKAAADRRQKARELRFSVISSITDDEEERASTSVWSKYHPRAVELYDHQNDPGENINVAAETKYADTLKDLQRLWRDGFCGSKARPRPSGHAAVPPACA